MIWSELMFGCFCVICLIIPTTIIHEIGHKIAMNYFGFGSKIHFGWKGGYCEYVTDRKYVPRSQVRIIAFSGGGFTSLVMFICYLFYPTLWILVWVFVGLSFGSCETLAISDL